MRNIVVTGGSRGLGLGIVRKLGNAGYQVLAIARRETNELRSAMEEVRINGSGCIRFRSFDLTEIEQIPILARSLHQDFGSTYGLVNNAAIGTDGLLALMHNSQIETLVRLNNLSPMILTKYVVRSMMAHGGGRIVNVASIAAANGYSGMSVYSATKAAMIGFTRSLAREVGSRGINVNAVAPGFLETEMTQQMDDAQRRQISRRSALKRLASVEDVADAVEFLMSERARSITGTVLTVDAGATA